MQPVIGARIRVGRKISNSKDKKTRYKGDDRNFSIRTALRNMIPRRILSGVTVVVVEDHDTIRSLVAEFLRLQGARVLDCSNAAQALERVIQERPDVVLSDINLPG